MAIRHAQSSDVRFSEEGRTAWDADHEGDASDIDFTQSGTGAGSQNLQAKVRRDVQQSPEDFGCAGDGTTDDTTNFGEFLDAASNKTNILTGTYKLTSLLSKALSNCDIIGIPGKTKITGAFDYAVIELLALDDVHFYGIEFETTYVNAVEDTGKSVVYSFQKNVHNVSFRHCKFTAPDANTSGLTFYARINAGDTSATIDGLWIEDCIFENIGRIGCTLMNRGTTNKYTSAQRVYFNRNKGKNLGLEGSYGFLISLDGFGSAFSVDHNELEECFGIGIENTGWINGSISHNQFRGFTAVWRPLSFSTNVQTGLSIIGNKCLEASSAQIDFVGVEDSVIRENVLERTAGSSVTDCIIFSACNRNVIAENQFIGAANTLRSTTLRNCNDNTFFGNNYKNEATGGVTALHLEISSGDCKRNRFYGETLDDSASTSQNAVLRFEGATCSDNLFINPVIKKGTGGVLYDEITSAANNHVLRASDGSTGIFTQNYVAKDFASDADVTLGADVHSSEIINMTDSGVVLTTGRNVVLPTQKRAWVVANATAQILTFKTAGGTGVAIPAGFTATVYCNGTNILLATPTVSYDTTNGVRVQGSRVQASALAKTLVAVVKNPVTSATRTSLTDNVAANVIQFTVAANSHASVKFAYDVVVFDGSSVAAQVEGGEVVVVANRASSGTPTVAVTKFGDDQALGSGTLTVTFAVSASAAGVVTVTCTADTDVATPAAIQFYPVIVSQIGTFDTVTHV